MLTSNLSSLLRLCNTIFVLDCRIQGLIGFIYYAPNSYCSQWRIQHVNWLNCVNLLFMTEEDEVKEDEYEKDERLDLEDNEPEYEPEEYGGEYDEKEGDQDDLQEEGDEGMEEVEDGDLDEEEEEEEEEGDVAEEDMEEVPEELEGEEDDEHADADEGQEHDHEPDHEQTELFDAAEAHEHHELFKERRKRKEFEVFVGGLDKDATKEDLKEVFSAVGDVTEVRLMMNPQTKKNKGFAFLRFATVEQAKRAVTELKNPVVFVLILS